MRFMPFVLCIDVCRTCKPISVYLQYFLALFQCEVNGPCGPSIFPSEYLSAHRLDSRRSLLLRWHRSQRNGPCLQHLYLNQSANLACIHRRRGLSSPRSTMPCTMSSSSSYSHSSTRGIYVPCTPPARTAPGWLVTTRYLHAPCL